MKKPGSQSVLTVFSFVTGSILLGALLYRVGLHALIRDLRQTGPCLFWIVILSGVRYVLRSIGWASSFLPEEKRPLSGLFGRQLAGDALAYLSLAGPLLGEPVKAALIQDVSFDDSLGSTILENFIYTLTAFAVSISGIVVLALLPFVGKAHSDTVAVAALSVAVAAVFALLAWERVTLPAILFWIGNKTGKRWRKIHDRIKALAGRMDRIRTQRPFGLWTIFLLALCAQALMLAEVALVLWRLGVSISLTPLLIVESATKLAKAAFFFVPGRVGADEGSSAGIVALLGMPASIGVTLSLLRRVRALLWAGVGLAFLGVRAARSRTDSDRVSARIPEG